MNLVVLVGFSIGLAFLAGIVLLRLEKKLALVTLARSDHAAKQASHVGTPMRVGGVAVMIGLTVSVGMAEMTGPNTFAPLLLFSVVPVLLAGLSEDLGHRVSARGRFVAAIFSAVAAMALLDVWVPRADIPGLDWVMTTPWIAMTMTVIFAAVFCHAVNLTDGMNGLAAVVVTTSALGCAGVALLASQHDILLFALLLAAVSVGFLFLNWPVARLFLGDAGAYGLGHLLVWLMILLTMRSSEVAVPAMVLVLFWPIAEVTHTVLRRALAKVSILDPDKMHLHQKIRRMLDIVWFGYKGRWRSNPLTTLIMLPAITAPVVVGVLLWNKPVAAWIALGFFMTAFAAAHPLTTHLARKYRK